MPPAGKTWDGRQGHQAQRDRVLRPRHRQEGRAGGVRAATPMGELIRPEDVANAVAFLVSDQSARITGEVLHVCAGSQLPLFLT
ncbi:SDR family oxidoreductase [Actinomadura sp. DSM 109109]|nr:SDR family oxidoreductase [Actinomadura lepetitiana]